MFPIPPRLDRQRRKQMLRRKNGTSVIPQQQQLIQPKGGYFFDEDRVLMRNLAMFMSDYGRCSIGGNPADMRPVLNGDHCSGNHHHQLPSLPVNQETTNNLNSRSSILYLTLLSNASQLRVVTTLKQASLNASFMQKYAEQVMASSNVAEAANSVSAGNTGQMTSSFDFYLNEEFKFNQVHGKNVS